MQQVQEKFDRLDDTNKISSISVLVAILALILSIFTGSISYFGYSINKAIEERNQIEWNIQQAKHRREFWKDIESTEESIIKQTGVIGEDLADYQIALIELLNEIGRLEYDNKEISLNNHDMKFMATYMKLLSEYASLQSSVEMIGVEYDNSVLTYDPLVKPLDIACWNLYLDEGKNISAWKKKVLKSYHDFYELIYSTVKNKKIPEDFESSITTISYNMGKIYKELSPPSLQGLMALKATNHPRYNKSKHSDAASCAGV